MEITSLPGPDRTITDEDLKNYHLVSKRYRNRRIGDFLKELKLIEGRNTGIPTILRALKNNGSDAPIFETDEESDYKLTIVQKNLDVKLDGNEIDGFQRYLEYWEANPDKPLILHTKNAIHFEKNHFFDDVRVIVSSYDLIKYQFNLPSGLSEDLGTDSDWTSLAKEIIKDGSFENACCSVFSRRREKGRTSNWHEN